MADFMFDLLHGTYICSILIRLTLGDNALTSYHHDRIGPVHGRSGSIVLARNDVRSSVNHADRSRYRAADSCLLEWGTREIWLKDCRTEDEFIFILSKKFTKSAVVTFCFIDLQGKMFIHQCTFGRTL